ncbi:MAG: hypothetical protein DMD35_04560 [Gemmatimonadetes bacterium]|nr:MAG: hypothetical protein DMD35_04560 [Gemmatimonadota bacterium]
MTPIRFFAALALVPCFAHQAIAQGDGTGRLEGIVVDSVHSRPLAGVKVLAVSAGSPTDVPRAAVSDSAGRYHFDALPSGRYMVGFESPLLDSLEIVLPPRAADVATGSTATMTLAVPPAGKLRAAVCSGATLPPGTGAIFGHVVDAETESPLPGAAIALAWWEMEVDRTTLRPDSRQRTASVSTDDGGWYRVCGVPTGTFLSMQLQYEGRTGAVLRTIVDDTLGVAIRHLSFSMSGSRADADSGTAAAPSDELPLSGTALLAGVVRGTGDTPLASAEVRVRGTTAVGYTDASGRYSLRGLPAGTQVLDVRHIGYGATESSVELRSGTTVTSDVRLQRIVNLDSIRVVAKRSRYVQFNQIREKSMGGYFIGPEELELQHVAMTSDLLWQIPGFRVLGNGYEAVVVSSRTGSLRPCRADVVINGAHNQPINDVNPAEVGAIAAYSEGHMVGAPPEFYGSSGCGLIIIWTKR